MRTHIIVALLITASSLFGMDIERRKQEQEKQLMALTKRITRQPSTKKTAHAELIAAAQLLRKAVLADEAYYNAMLKEQFLPAPDKIEALQAKIKNEQFRMPTITALRLIEDLADEPNPSYPHSTFHHLSCAICTIILYPLKYYVDKNDATVIAEKYDEQLPTRTEDTGLYKEFMNTRLDLWLH